MRIYLDIDDTLADFRGHVIERGVPKYTGTWYTDPPENWTEEQRHIDNETNAVMMREGFWLDLPVAEGAFEIIAAAAVRGDVWLLTALPARVRPEIRREIAADKIMWAENKLHFPPERVITCLREQKADYCKRPTGPFELWPLLVDDNARTCKEWRERGGWAIQHKDWRVTVDEIKRLL